jgi:hypothetical protein
MKSPLDVDDNHDLRNNGMRTGTLELMFTLRKRSNKSPKQIKDTSPTEVPTETTVEDCTKLVTYPVFDVISPMGPQELSALLKQYVIPERNTDYTISFPSPESTTVDWEDHLHAVTLPLLPESERMNEKGKGKEVERPETFPMLGDGDSGLEGVTRRVRPSTHDIDVRIIELPSLVKQATPKVSFVFLALFSRPAIYLLLRLASQRIWRTHLMSRHLL